MGRNGAGKSTLLRHAAGLLEPTRGRVRARRARGAAAAEPRRPTSCTSASARRHPRGAPGGRARGLAERHPRDLSGGQRQRLASRSCSAASAAAAPARPGRADARHGPRRQAPARRRGCSAQAAAGRLVLVATHDCEFAAEFADACRAARRRAGDRRRARSRRCSPAGATSRPNRRASSAAPAVRCGSRTRPRCCTDGARARPRGVAAGGGGADVSWQLASFAIVLGSLAGAFWWYERSHPPAKLLAIVAALAALAALGRDAFAAVPDVKPITAIVLVAGLASAPRRASRSGRSPRSPPTCCSARDRGRRGRCSAGGSSGCSAPAWAR